MKETLLNRILQYRQGGFPKKESVVDGIVLLAIALFILSYFEPQYLFSKTITTGGDTASHYYTAWYLRHHLLPQGQISGWTPGNYAGFPMLESYFPLPFLLMSALSFFISLEVAFKLITVLGIFLLPLCSYGALRWIGYASPVPILGALFTLPFLFMEANSMWGGNIPSTLAGEFAFSISMALSFLFLGSFYHGMVTGKHIIRNAFLIFLVGLSHSYTLLFTGFTSLFFLWTLQDFKKKFIYSLKVHLLGFFLMSFWIVPLLAYLSLTSGVSLIWIFQSMVKEVFPRIFYPFLGFALLAIPFELYRRYQTKLWDTRTAYVAYGIGVGIAGYLLAPPIGISDIRFVPFVQYFLMLLGAIGFYTCIQKLRGQIVVLGIVCIFVFLWVNQNVTFIPDWIAWNYSGFESKNIWPQFQKVNERLRGNPSDPRVMYEHSQLHNATGTPRAFESLPLFSGRSTLEGIYLHASGNAPFILNIQSEISKEASCPFPQYSCARHNIDQGIKHLEMFNVRDVLAITPEVKAELRQHPKFQHIETIPPYDLYQLTTHSNRYVVPLTHQPILLKTKDWKTASYQWFKDFKNNDVHLVFPRGEKDKAFASFTEISSYAIEEDRLLPRIPIDVTGELKETVREDEVLIETTLINKPHLVKISYHPNWKVEGADQIYLVSPAFMLIYPTQNKVRLYYGQSAPEYIGKFLSLMGWGFCFLSLFFRSKAFPFHRLAQMGETPLFQKMSVRFVGISSWFEERKVNVLRAVILSSLISLTGVVLTTYKQDAVSLLNRGIKAKDSGDFVAARASFKKIIERHPLSANAENAKFYSGVSYYMENNCQEAISEFNQLIKRYPDTIWVPAAYYHIGLCERTLGHKALSQETFQRVVHDFPETPWGQSSQERLDEESVTSAQYLFGQAVVAFNQGQCEAVKQNVQTLLDQKSEFKKMDEALALQAVCFFKEGDYKKTIQIFSQLIQTFPQSALHPEAYYNIALSSQLLKRIEDAEKNYKQVIALFPESSWAKQAQQGLNMLNEAAKTN